MYVENISLRIAGVLWAPSFTDLKGSKQSAGKDMKQPGHKMMPTGGTDACRQIRQLSHHISPKYPS